MTFVNILIVLSLAAVVVVLGLGLFNLVRGGDPEKSNKLMRYRVMAQAVAIGLLALGLMMKMGGSH